MQWVLLTLISIAIFQPVYAGEFNAGFIQGLWYSDEPFAGETVRVYVALRNNTGADLTGTVEFFDNDKQIERNNISALDGRIIESWADWTPSHGEHTLSATLSRIELHTVGSSTQAVTVTSALAEDIVFVDYDTDKDGIGNNDDTDDDGDGVSDAEEQENGTDPLTYDEPAQEENEEAETETSSENNDSSTESSNTSPEGLEQFLTPSPAEHALSGITDFVQNTKRNLDTYREKRNQAGSENENEVEEIIVNEDGFGEITRTQSERQDAEKPKIKSDGFVAVIFDVLGSIWNTVYTAVLFALSFYLGHPILVQLTILFGILFVLYKLARKFGARPS